MKYTLALAKATTLHNGLHRTTRGARSFPYPLDRGWVHDPDFEAKSHIKCLHFAPPGDAISGRLSSYGSHRLITLHTMALYGKGTTRVGRCWHDSATLPVCCMACDAGDDPSVLNMPEFWDWVRKRRGGDLGDGLYRDRAALPEDMVPDGLAPLDLGWLREKRRRPDGVFKPWKTPARWSIGGPDPWGAEDLVPPCTFTSRPRSRVAVPIPRAFRTTDETPAVIKVVGVGGAGGKVVQRLLEVGVRDVEYIVMDTDEQDIPHPDAHTRISIGDERTKGLVAGGDPAQGTNAAMESRDRIYEALKGADMVFITCGMGGGTGSGAFPVVAQIAKDAGALCVGVVTLPYESEGTQRRNSAEDGIRRLEGQVDTLIVIPNDRILQIQERWMTRSEAFRMADDVLRQAIQGISEIITEHGDSNQDFADVGWFLSDAGLALTVTGRGTGEHRAVDAARAAIESPLLVHGIDGATGVLFEITGDEDIGLPDLCEAAELIHEAADPDAQMIFGYVVDKRLQGEAKLTLIATGFDRARQGSVANLSPVSTVGQETESLRR